MESTSLEEDFYFLPPEALKKLSEEEEARAFEEELALFEKARDAKDPAPLEGYLRSYPSGRFAELAQLQLDRVLAAQGEKPVEIAPAAGNPNTAGTARTDTKFRVGVPVHVPRHRPQDGRRAQGRDVDDHRHHRRRSHLQPRPHDPRSAGQYRQDGKWPSLHSPAGQAADYVIGKKWSTRFGVAKRWKDRHQRHGKFKVEAREKVTVPAGTFDCFRVEAWGVNRRPGRKPRDVHLKYWMAPGEVRMVIAREEQTRATVRGHVTVLNQERSELVSFRQR